MRQILLVCALSSLLLSCTGGILQVKKKYTPLNLYYNPLELAEGVAAGRDYDQPAYYYPFFLNYPDDLKKHGLRGKVSSVRYLNIKNATYAELKFNEEGNLTYTGDSFDKPLRYTEGSGFTYTGTGKLEGVYRNPQKIKFPQKTQDFEYDATDKLIKRKMAPYNQTYTYYEDGTLQETTLFKSKKHDIFEKMEFNESGNLVKEYRDYTLNPFLGEAKSQFHSACTFVYTSNGLCTQKKETLYPIRKNKSTKDLDSICCHNIYEYNLKGDIIQWEYSDYDYKDSISKRISYLTFLFEYEYDQYDNWTTMKVILPKYYNNDRRALANIANIHDVFGLLSLGTSQQDPNAKITFRRVIQYHEQSSSSLTSETEPSTLPLTAVRGHGLYGKVKSVSDNNCTITFNKEGNIVSKVWKDEYNSRDDYTYESPTRYMIGTVIGPYRITCEGNIRKEEDEKGIELPVEYKFDKQGRVIYYSYPQGMMGVTEEYSYTGNDKQPNSMRIESPYEEGNDVSISKYTYLKFDKQGNWTKRKVNRTWEITEYIREEGGDSEKTRTETDPEFIETRTIQYF